MEKGKRKREPIRQSVHVHCPIEDAFRLFTERFAEWWPLALHSIAGDDAEKCAIEPWRGGRVFECTRSGEEIEWGSVTAWDPPEHLKLMWHPGGPADSSQTVDVEFQTEADGTRVTVIHTGWETSAVPVCGLQGDHSIGWPAIVQRCFAEFVSSQALVAV